MYPGCLNYTQYVASNAPFSSLKPSKRYSPWENKYTYLANFSIQFYYVKTQYTNKSQILLVSFFSEINIQVNK